MAYAASDQYDRALVAKDAALSSTPTDEEGELLTFDGTPAAVQVLDGAGVPIGEPVDATLSDDAHTFSATIPSATLALLDTFTLSWQATIGSSGTAWETTLETVGGYYFTFAAYRAQGKECEAASPADVMRWRLAAEVFIDGRTKSAYVPRGQRETIQGDGGRVLVLARNRVRSIYSLSVTYEGTTVDWTDAQIAMLEHVPSGILELPARATVGAWPASQPQPGRWMRGATVNVHYAHGYDRPSPKMSRAAAYLARMESVPDSKGSPNAVLQVVEGVTFRLATPDADHPSGIPWIDELLEREGNAVPSVG